MKIFLSWSGTRSQKIAQLFHHWVQRFIQTSNPWISDRNIDKGSVWFQVLYNQLEENNNGIICLTKSNINSPWILFESGALAKGINDNRLFTFLIDVKAKDITGPLAQFNHTTFEKEELWKLLNIINQGSEPNQIDDDVLNDTFELLWPKFEEEFNEILKQTSEPVTEEVFERSEDDILGEILDSVRRMDRMIMTPETGNKFPRSIERKLSEKLFHSARLMLEDGEDVNYIYGQMQTTFLGVDLYHIINSLHNAIDYHMINTLPHIILSKHESKSDS